jgi:hypothetical protein
MKRKLAWLLIVALLLMLFPVVTNAMEEGEMLLTSESVQGAVGDIVKVDFYCYPNLDEGLVMDSFEGTLDYDPEMLTLGSINLRDEEQNLNSLMNSKSPLWIPSKSEAGKLAFAYADAFGTDANGFLFQLEFRIEKEGACEFVFNGIRYHAIDASSYRSVGSFYINPVQIGGVYTEGYEITENGTPAATYDPLEPAVETQRPQATDTPKPSNSGHSVPQTSQLPEPSIIATPDSGLVTPKPPVTSMPMNTPSGATIAPTEAATEAPATDDPNGTVETTEPAAETQEPGTETDATEAPVAEVTAEPVGTIETPKPTAEPGNTDPNPVQQPNRALVIAVIAGIVVVILLAILAIILILIRNKRQREEN